MFSKVGFYSFVLRLVGLFGSLFLTILLSQYYMEFASYGSAVLAISAINVLAALAEFGYTNYIIRLSTRSNASRKNARFISYLFLMGFILLWPVASILFQDLVFNYLGCLMLIGLLLQRMKLAELRADGQVLVQQFLEWATIPLSLLLACSVLFWRNEGKQLEVSDLMEAYIYTSIVLFLSSIFFIRFFSKNLCLPEVRSEPSFDLKERGLLMSNFLFNRSLIDIKLVVIGALYGDNIVAVLRITSQLSDVILLPQSVITNLDMKKYSLSNGASNVGKSIARGRRFSAFYGFGLFCVVVVFFLLKDQISHYFGVYLFPEIGVAFFLLIALSRLINASFGPLGPFFSMNGKSQYLLLVQSFCVSVFIAFNLILSSAPDIVVAVSEVLFFLLLNSALFARLRHHENIR